MGFGLIEGAIAVGFGLIEGAAVGSAVGVAVNQSGVGIVIVT